MTETATAPAATRIPALAGPPENGAFYPSVASFEHCDAGRTARFPLTRTVQETAGAERVEIEARVAPREYSTLYNVATRDPGELFAYGGFVSQGAGAYLAKLDPATLEEVWRRHIHLPHHWNYPGVAAVLADGFVYAIAGNVLARFHPETGEQRTITLPQHEGQGTAAYNGFVVSPDGILFAKSMERGHPCDESGTATNLGLPCGAHHNLPSFLVAVDTRDERMPIVAQVETREFILGRIETERRDGVDYVYCPGIRSLWRYRFQNGRLEQDLEWGPVDYVGKGQPGTAAAIMDDWVIIQNNGFQSPMEPLTISAIHTRDPRRVHAFQPFPGCPMSCSGSKPAVDPENRRVFTAEFAGGWLAALDLDPERGFSLRWKVRQKMFCFAALIGGPDDRQIVGTDWDPKQGDRAVWRDAATGAPAATSPILDLHYNAAIVTPGFGGVFHYVGFQSKTLQQLRPVPARGA
ncbi:MAG TPA: hypothetical protein VJT67_10840 [Longimicrobiaceae bacterium]|nr:hypothetical protein [Longimicrobiaceae bacterium]